MGRALLAGLALLFALRVVQLTRRAAAPVPVTTGALATGSAAPDFELPLIDGGRFHLAAERGHPVVLSFWASWCGPCKAELPGVERAGQKLRQAPHVTRLVAVNTEGDRAVAAAKARELGLTMPVAIDDGAASQAYRIANIPRTVVIDAAGRIAAVYAFITEDELMRAVSELEARQVKP
jgi:thiol-disulfide isomerase/thioredoxin